MSYSERVLENDEKAIMDLRGLYRQYGYRPYKMSRFEEYELYLRNKDFLVSDAVITFTDTNGRLMALKPDVTLSIVKNYPDGEPGTRKLYYNENVYRVSQRTHEFKEIMQAGLECVGQVDDYCVYEVIVLAAKSLDSISKRNVLNLSHMGFLAGALEYAGFTGDVAQKVLACIGEKNAHTLQQLCAQQGVSEQAAGILQRLAVLYEPLQKGLSALSGLCVNEKTTAAYRELCAQEEALTLANCSENLYLDFSVINDMRYYDGIIFQGFVDGVPTGVLSGGRYDGLMKRFGKKAGAIGFAVYLDLLERLDEQREDYDADVLLLYNETTPVQQLAKAVQQYTAAGVTVSVQKQVPLKQRYRHTVRIDDIKAEKETGDA